MRKKNQENKYTYKIRIFLFLSIEIALNTKRFHSYFKSQILKLQ